MINPDAIYEKIWSEDLGRGWVIFKDGSSLPLFGEEKNPHREIVYREAQRLLQRKKEALERLKASGQI